MFSWIYPSILSWEKPGIASLTTSVCVTGSKRVGEIYVDPVIFIYSLWQEWFSLMFSSGAARK